MEGEESLLDAINEKDGFENMEDVDMVDVEEGEIVIEWTASAKQEQEEEEKEKEKRPCDVFKLSSHDCYCLRLKKIGVLCWYFYHSMVQTFRIFDSVDHDFDKLEVSSGSELKNKPDGWESLAKEQDGNLWEMSQREEDILLQEFDHWIAFCKFQIASFIKQHIFSRRRPIDGWRYMIEVI